MKKLSKSQERKRCESSEGTSTCILTSILKKPNKSRRKHQRSVRFEDPQGSIPGSHLSPTSSYLEPLNTSPSSTLTTSPSKSTFSSTSPIKFTQISSKPPNPGECVKKTPIKILKITKKGNNFDFKDSPKSGQKVLHLDCRDEKFYNKLNFFLNAKTSVSPARCADTYEKVLIRLENKKEITGKEKGLCRKSIVGKVSLGRTGNYLLN